MKGHIRRRGKAWAVVISLGKRPDGSGYRQKWYTVHGKKEDAERFLHDRLSELYGTGYLPTTEKTFADFAEEWLANYVRLRLRPSTAHNYAQRIGMLLPFLGQTKLTRLTPKTLLDGYSALRGKYAAATVNSVHACLHGMLACAVRWRYLTRNPADDVDAPESAVRIAFWTPEQVGQFLAHVKKMPLYPAYYLAIATGLRRGELLGLKWEDVDLEQGRIMVRREWTYPPLVLQERTKPGPPHSVPISPQTCAMLQEHRTRATLRRWAKGQKPSEWLFASPVTGSPVHPAYFSSKFGLLCRRAGVPRIRVHDLRHSFASLLIAQGVNLKAVQELLNHKTPGVTLKYYTHLLPGVAEEAVASLDSVLSTSLAGSQKAPANKPSSR